MRSSQSNTQHGLESLKIEIKSRDELIQKLREEILCIQDKCEIALNEVSKFFWTSFFKSKNLLKSNLGFVSIKKDELWVF